MAYVHTSSVCRPTTPTKRPGFWARLWRMRDLRHQRAQLLDLDDHMLRDVGLTAEEARHEAARPPWDAPANWMK